MVSGVTELKDHPSEERKEQPGTGKELREHQRVPLKEDASIFKLDEGFNVLGNCDISEGGLSFYSDRKFAPGRRMRLNIKNTLSVEIEVVRCEMVMVDETFMEAKYQVGAKFVDGPIDHDLYNMVLNTIDKP